MLRSSLSQVLSFTRGRIFSGSAWIRAEGGGDLGLPAMEPAELRERVVAANASGMAVAIHAIGDRALAVALDAVDAARIFRSALERAGFHNRIEHVQLGSPEAFARMSRLGVVASMQPLHASADRALAQRDWGARCRYAYAWRSVLDAGVELALGSDAPVESAHPLLGLSVALTRQDGEGRPPGGWYRSSGSRWKKRCRGTDRARPRRWAAAEGWGACDREPGLTSPSSRVTSCAAALRLRRSTGPGGRSICDGLVTIQRRPYHETAALL